MAEEGDIKKIEELLEKIAGDKTSRGVALGRLHEKEKNTVKASIANAREMIKHERERIRAMKAGSDARKDATKTLNEFEKKLDDTVDLQEKQKKTIDNVIGAFTGLYGTIEKGEGTISSFTDGLKGKGVFGTAFSVLGTRLDTNIETFRQLSQTGANFGQSIVQMREAAGQALLPLDDFAALVAQNSQNLAALFGSTTEGARAIASLSEGMRTASVDSLAPLGFTVDEINSTLLLNLERQRRTFNFDANARTQNIQSAINFAKQLDRLAKLTGTQREELQKQIEQQMSNERFQAMLAGSTDETRQRLENFAATIGSISPELTEGFQDLIANAGRPVTEAALALVQNMPEAQSAIQNLISGVTTSEQALMSVRNAAIRSQDRFRQATVTGTVEFLSLQGGVIKLGSTAMNLNAVMAEQAAAVPGLTQGLTTFQDSAKRLSSQFQMIETGLLSAFGPALGGLANATQGIMGGLGKMVAGLAQIPALTGSLILTGLVGKFLLDKTAQTAVVFSGTYAALRASGMGEGGFFSRILGSGKGTKGRSGIGRALNTTAGRAVGGLGAVIGVGSSAGMLMNKDKKDDAAGWGGLAGAIIGGGLGMLAGPGGALLGASLGSMAGQGIGSMFGGKQHGGPMAGGNPHLVGETGPEIVMTKSNANVLSNSDTKNMLNTKNLEKHMLSMVTAVSPLAGVLNEVHKTLNTSNMINNKTRIATETSARKDRNQVGMV